MERKNFLDTHEHCILRLSLCELINLLLHIAGAPRRAESVIAHRDRCYLVRSGAGSVNGRQCHRGGEITHGVFRQVEGWL